MMNERGKIEFPKVFSLRVFIGFLLATRQNLRGKPTRKTERITCPTICPTTRQVDKTAETLFRQELLNEFLKLK